LILIEEASVVGDILRGTVLKVEKLMFVPLRDDIKMTIDQEDQAFVNMINKI
jgi:hypothetical protein